VAEGIKKYRRARARAAAAVPARICGCVSEKGCGLVEARECGYDNAPATVLREETPKLDAPADLLLLLLLLCLPLPFPFPGGGGFRASRVASICSIPLLPTMQRALARIRAPVTDFCRTASRPRIALSLLFLAISREFSALPWLEDLPRAVVPRADLKTRRETEEDARIGREVVTRSRRNRVQSRLCAPPSALTS